MQFPSIVQRMVLTILLIANAVTIVKAAPLGEYDGTGPSTDICGRNCERSTATPTS